MSWGTSLEKLIESIGPVILQPTDENWERFDECRDMLYEELREYTATGRTEIARKGIIALYLIAKDMLEGYIPVTPSFLEKFPVKKALRAGIRIKKRAGKYLFIGEFSSPDLYDAAFSILETAMKIEDFLIEKTGSREPIFEKVCRDSPEVKKIIFNSIEKTLKKEADPSWKYALFRALIFLGSAIAVYSKLGYIPAEFSVFIKYLRKYDKEMLEDEFVKETWEEYRKKIKDIINL